VQGCTSDAGKSLLAAALCRHLANRGLRVAPFKAQNMSNNAAVCLDGGEIGRAQYLQAVAARIEPDVRMNPVLLKPGSETLSHVVLLGRPAPELSSIAWGERRAHTWPVVLDALASLRSSVDLVIAEGAGSPAEVNLRDADIVNMAVALECDAHVYLVADIDRGGAFAHLLGTMQCLSSDERALVAGFVLNKFRGDASLLAPAPQWLEVQTGVPVVGVVPWLRHRLPDEDRLLLHTADVAGSPSLGRARVAVIAFPWASNFDEFEGLGARPEVSVTIVREREDMRAYDAVILPGSRNTAASLRWLRSSGVALEVTRAAMAGVYVLGICGGMQMLGRRIEDPLGIEAGGSIAGLGLLDLETTLEAAKTTRLVTATVAATGQGVSGYEIHHGVTTAGPLASPELLDGLGWTQDNVTGVYLHGLLDDQVYVHRFLSLVGVEPRTDVDRATALDAELDQLARSVAATGWCDHIERRLGLGGAMICE
jgi:adenosylcobyric acid synthase